MADNERKTGAGDDAAPAPDKKLSLWPLTVDEAVEAILQVPPMPKDNEKAPSKGRRKGKVGS